MLTAPAPRTAAAEEPWSAPARAARCTCHSIREFSGGHFGSLAMLGVACEVCEASMEEYAEQARREALTPGERDAEDIAARWSCARRRLERIARRPGSPSANPPF